MIANLSVRALDESVTELSKPLGLTYTRYADDLCLSTQNPDFTRGAARRLIGRIYEAMGSCGLSPNLTKTHVLPPGARKVVLGLLVNGKTPRLTREFRANLRMHLYYLESLGPVSHQVNRNFISVRSLRNHIEGLVNFAQHIEPDFAQSFKATLARIAWPL
jgi:hypothetical protein